jgi:hypothetical protein
MTFGGDRPREEERGEEEGRGSIGVAVGGTVHRSTEKGTRRR